MSSPSRLLKEQDWLQEKDTEKDHAEKDRKLSVAFFSGQKSARPWCHSVRENRNERESDSNPLMELSPRQVYIT